MIPHGILDTDRVVPSGSFTSPGIGATVSGVITLTISAADNDQISAVQFRIDGNNIGASDTVAPYSVSYDTRGVLNGNHTLSAIITDRVGNVTIVSNTVNIENNPVCSMTAPGNGATVSGTVTLSCNVTSYDASISTQFKIDGNSVQAAQGGAGAHSISVDTMAYANGGHTFSATATDSHGNVSISSISATISNTPPGLAQTPNLVCSGSNAQPDRYGTSQFCPAIVYAQWYNKGYRLQYRYYLDYTADQKPPYVWAEISQDGGGSISWNGEAWDTGAAGGDYVVGSGWYNITNVMGGAAPSQVWIRLVVANESGGNPQWTDMHNSNIAFQWV